MHSVEGEAAAARQGGPDLARSATGLGAPLPALPGLLLSLQPSGGNRAVSGLVQRWREAVREVGAVQRASPERRGYADVTGAVLQRWPSPEVDDKPGADQFQNYKCHDAVVYWVLRSLGMDRAKARNALNLMHQKRGPSIGWIVEALGYGSNTRVSSPTEVAVGDILFTGSSSYVMHTMVVIDANKIAGFNNSGTFGTTGGDEYSEEKFAERKYWHRVNGAVQIGTGPDASFPIYKVTFTTAQTALVTFLARLETEADYKSPLDVDVGETTGTGATAKATKKDRCFITTAVALTRGLPDDCDELTTLRAFRDTYVMQKTNGLQLIDDYYRYSPLILEAIARQPNRARIHQQLYDVISSCVDAVKRGDNEFAFSTYCAMVNRLRVHYLS